MAKLHQITHWLFPLQKHSEYEQSPAVSLGRRLLFSVTQPALNANKEVLSPRSMIFFLSVNYSFQPQTDLKLSIHQWVYPSQSRHPIGSKQLPPPPPYPACLAGQIETGKNNDIYNVVWANVHPSLSEFSAAHSGFSIDFNFALSLFLLQRNQEGNFGTLC